jgi:hypothetical protein
MFRTARLSTPAKANQKWQRGNNVSGFRDKCAARSGKISMWSGYACYHRPDFDMAANRGAVA